MAKQLVYGTEEQARHLALAIYKEVVLFPWDLFGLECWVAAIMVRKDEGYTPGFYVRLAHNKHFSVARNANNPNLPVWLSDYMASPQDPDAEILTKIQSDKGGAELNVEIVFDEDTGVKPSIEESSW